MKLVSLSVSCISLLLQLVDETEYTQNNREQTCIIYLPAVWSLSDVPADTFFL